MERTAFTKLFNVVVAASFWKTTIREYLKQASNSHWHFDRSLAENTKMAAWIKAFDSPAGFSCLIVIMIVDFREYPFDKTAPYWIQSNFRLEQIQHRGIWWPKSAE